jgi:DNA-nicking Smr family endonuclease
VKRGLRPEELSLWAVVTSTVRAAPGRLAPVPPAAPKPEPKVERLALKKPASIAAAPKPVAKRPVPPPPPADIEPGRKRRLIRERDPIGLALDLHGLDQDRARGSLVRFLTQAQAEGERAVLVITGKGSRGDGVLRRFAPDWLSDPALRGVVAGWSPAHRRHGGDGALYVALKRPAERR